MKSSSTRPTLYFGTDRSLRFETKAAQWRVSKGKHKGKCEFVQRLVPKHRRSGMARVLKGSHSFTCTPRVYPLTE